MKLYKVLIFLILLIFCAGSVCAAEPDNNTMDDNNNIMSEIWEQKDFEIEVLEDEVAKQSNEIKLQKSRIKYLENNSAEKNIKINKLNKVVNNQSVKINELNNIVNNQNSIINESNKIINDLKEDNKALKDTVDKYIKQEKEVHKPYVPIEEDPNSFYYGMNTGAAAVILGTTYIWVAINIIGIIFI